jgi:hypothetical protein
MGNFLIIAHKVKHVLYRYFPENWRCEEGLAYSQENMVYINISYIIHKIVWKTKVYADKES